MKTSVLIVDDNVPLLKGLAQQLASVGCAVSMAATLAEGRALLADAIFDVALVDYTLPDGIGPDLVRWMVANARTQVAYCMSGDTSCAHVVLAMRAGCRDVLPKPINMGLLRELFGQRATTQPQLAEWRERVCPRLVGDDPRVLDFLRLTRDVAETDTTVLITGESGTGKEVVAQALHAGSPRCDKPFVVVNCASIPESLVEAELFGHVRGAFTGAVAPREGRVASAHEGTLFLDEIGDMPLAAQAKLLRVLEDRCVTPVGADRSTRIDVRIIAATNRDLEAMIDAGTFREDLFFRLSVLTLELPPLRDRRSDIMRLATHFLHDANVRTGRTVCGFDDTAEEALLCHLWPGNVRELANTIERAVVTKREGVLSARDLLVGRRTPRNVPARVVAVHANLNLKAAIDGVERQLIEQALERAAGNRSEAAALLGLNRTTLVEKLRRISS